MKIGGFRAALAEWIGIISGLLSILGIQNLRYCPDIETRLTWTAISVLLLIYFTTYRGLIRRIHLSQKVASRHIKDKIEYEHMNRQSYLEWRIKNYFNDEDIEKGIVWHQIQSSLPFAIITLFATPWGIVFDFLNSHFNSTHTVYLQNEPPQEIPVVLFEWPLMKLLFIMASYALILFFSVVSAKNIFNAEQIDFSDE